MHPSAEQLLSTSSPASDADISAHLEHCARCRGDLDAYQATSKRLRALPQLQLDSVAWSTVRARLDSEAKSAAQRRAALRVAAGVAAIAMLLALGMTVKDSPSPEPMLAENTTGNELVSLMEHSRQLDLMLQELPNRPRVERVAMAATLDSIEGRIQWLDAELTYGALREQDQEHLQRLWRERVELMDSLVKVRYAQTGSVSF